jgi:hypothetical protein
MGHGFAIVMAHVGALRPCGAPAPVNFEVRPSLLKVRFLEMPINIGSQVIVYFMALHA